MSRMPVLFLGHGSPMNALADNAFTDSLKKLGQSLPKPRAIVCVSAHWETTGAQILHTESPETIHDFYGFPEELFKIQYPANGGQEFAREVQKLLPAANLSEAWGLDHGTWSMLVHMYPNHDIPVFQLSLDRNLTAAQHYELGQKLLPMRDQGVLIVGSGDIVHNLRLLKRQSSADQVYPWAKIFDDGIAKAISDRNVESVINYENTWKEEARLSVPTAEHFLPLLYTLGASTPEDQVSFPFTGFEMGSISLRSVLWSSDK